MHGVQKLQRGSLVRTLTISAFLVFAPLVSACGGKESVTNIYNYDNRKTDNTTINNTTNNYTHTATSSGTRTSTGAKPKDPCSDVSISNPNQCISSPNAIKCNVPNGKSVQLDGYNFTFKELISVSRRQAVIMEVTDGRNRCHKIARATIEPNGISLLYLVRGKYQILVKRITRIQPDSINELDGEADIVVRRIVPVTCTPLPAPTCVEQPLLAPAQPPRTFTVIDADSGQRYTESVRGSSISGCIIYSFDPALPQCSASTSGLWNSCNRNSINHIAGHNVSVLFNGQPVKIFGMSIDQASTQSAINLAKEFVGGIIDVGDTLEVGCLRVRLDAIKDGSTIPEQGAIISVLDANNNILKQTVVSPGYDHTISAPGYPLFMIYVPKTSPGYTFGAVWADIRILHQITELTDRTFPKIITSSRTQSLSTLLTYINTDGHGRLNSFSICGPVNATFPTCQ